MKKIFRPLYLSLALGLVLASCGSQKMVSTPVENVDNLPLKITPLADKDLKRWSHLDLVKDTVPGMSVDKAYAELLKGKKGQKVIVGIVDSGVDINHEDLNAIKTEDKELLKNKTIMTQIGGMIGEGFVEKFQDEYDHVFSTLNYNLNVDFDGRKIVGDNPNDLKDTKYGNNNVVGPEPKEAKHGTHVAGIVAQVRGNNKGGDGVTNNAQIMAVRAVPNGDEYDKDIALGIRYAVDNGAKVINGSFGKYFSQNKEWVIDAIKYAESKDVLVVIAAGNESYDLDVTNKYPNDTYDGSPEFAKNVLIIGALSPAYGSKMVASFSNYGKTNVDIYAPGDKIYATTPLNTYEYLQGTSMASPNVAGVATLIRSYYPNLTAVQVKQIIMESGTPLKNQVVIGEDKHKANFADASKSGKIVNAYNALLLAEIMSKK